MSIGEQNFRGSSESTIRTRLGTPNLVFSKTQSHFFATKKKSQPS